MKLIYKYIPISVLTAFALLTLFLSSSVILDLFEIREKEGNYVLFVVWANFISSILYLIAAYNWYRLKPFSVYALLTSLFILITAQIALHAHIDGGGVYEEKTVKAMFFRIGVTAIFTIWSYLAMKRNKRI